MGFNRFAYQFSLQFFLLLVDYFRKLRFSLVLEVFRLLIMVFSLDDSLVSSVFPSVVVLCGPKAPAEGL